MMKSTTQEWVQRLPFMQQSVLLSAIRGPDGVSKYHDVKFIQRWYRRCVLISAFDQEVITNPYDSRGGSFTGPSYFNFSISKDNWEVHMGPLVDKYMRTVDELPYHFQTHFMQAIQIVGYKHSDERIRNWWYSLYCRLVNDLHLNIELEQSLDRRLNDNRRDWLDSADKATTL